MTRIIALANQKGGVGKTTTAVNLATALAAVKHRILLIDNDPQGNASTGLGLEHSQDTSGTYHLLIGAQSIQEVIQPTLVKGLDIIAGSTDLAAAESELAALNDHQFRLRNSLVNIQDSYDFIFIDCPPGLGFLAVNALTAASDVLVPLQCEYYALEGLTRLLHTVSHIQRHLNPSLHLFGILLTMFGYNRLADQIADDVQIHFGDTVFKTRIPRNIRIAEAPSHGKPLLLYDHKCAGAFAYAAVAREFLDRLASTQSSKNRSPQPIPDVQSPMIDVP